MSRKAERKGNLTDAGENVLDNLKTLFVKAGATGEGVAKRNTPVDTGALRRSITAEVEEDANTITVTIYTNLEYAPHQEYGTKKGIVGKFFMQKGVNAALKKIEQGATGTKLTSGVKKV